MKIFKTIILILLVAILVVFAAQNIEIVRFTFIKWHLELPLAVASIALYILGAISGSMVFSLLKKITHTSEKTSSDDKDDIES
ncbi:MAG TPA: LapA family protein [Bacteroidales bacterium]|jgi:uncharacterized integral membrane protein|nr:LapA family protein [Bacteroidales bacterium]MDD4236541.1 LapA family protein [Bacteroidales bacterium]HRW21858.1 LapA family protein [Bacteroidales bacterium]